MPIYEYRCKKCGHEFEEIVGANDPVPVCPACHAGKAEKLLSKACFRSSSGSDAAFCGSGGCDAGASHASSGCAGCSGGSCATCR